MQSPAKCVIFGLLAGSLIVPLFAQTTAPSSGHNSSRSVRAHHKTAPQPPAAVPAQAPQVTPTPTPSAETRPAIRPSSPPRVSYQGGQLMVVAENSSLSDTLSAIRAATGLRIEGAGGGSDRVMAKIGPAPVRDVLLSLLEGSRYDFAMLGSVTDPQKIERLVLSPRVAASAAGNSPPPAQPAADDSAAAQPPTGDDDDNEGFAEPAKPAPGTPGAAVPGQPATPPQVKTPEQLLEDLKKLEADRARQQQTQPNQPTDPNAPRPARPDRPK